MFVSPAFAQGLGGPGGGDFVTTMLPLVLIFVVFYFLLIRPQQKRMKDQKAKISAVRRGDRVVTGGGLIGTVSKVVDDNEVLVELAEGVRVRVVRQTITDVIAKGEPADSDKGEGKSEAKSGEGEGKSEGGLLGRLGRK
ncbi:MAG: preprotein translocase subunit YajC [Alphaproteobacteria bacterium]